MIYNILIFYYYLHLTSALIWMIWLWREYRFMELWAYYSWETYYARSGAMMLLLTIVVTGVFFNLIYILTRGNRKRVHWFHRWAI